MSTSTSARASLRPLAGLAVAPSLLLAGTSTESPTAEASEHDPATHCPAPGTPGETELENQGPAVSGFPVNMAERIGDRLYIFSLSLSPSRIVEYDLVERQVTDTIEVPTGTRTWATTADGTDLYFGQWGTGAGQDNLYRFDTIERELDGLAAIESQGEFWALEVGTDGRIYAGTRRAGVVYAYDPATGDVDEVQIEGAHGQMTAMATVGDDLYVGQGWGEPALFEVDLATYETRDITPPEISDGVSVYYSMAATEEYVAFGTQQEPARFNIVSRHDPASYESIALDGESIIGAVTFSDDAVFFSGISTGNLYRYDLQTREVEHVATPVPIVPTRRSFIVGDTLVGVSVPESVWEYDLETRQVAHTDLIGAGADGAPEQPQSLAVTPSNIVVGKNNGVQVVPFDDDRDPHRFVVPGEAKAMVTVGEDVYIALYPQGRLWRYDDETASVDQVANWRDAQNRPRVAHYHNGLDRVLVGVSSDFGAGGALASYDPRSGETTLFERPFGTNIPVDAITSWRDKAVIAGTSANAPLALIDPVTGELGWSTTPVPGGGDIRALVTDREVVHGLTGNGTIFTVDPSNGDVLDTKPNAVAGSTPGELLLHDGHLYAVSRQQLVKLPLAEPVGLGDAIVVVDNLDGRSFNRPPLRRGPDCALYVFTGFDLLRVSDDSPTADAVVPTADAHVRGGSFADENLGSTDNLEVKFQTSADGNFYRKAFLRFDVEGLEAEPDEYVVLRLRVETIGSAAGAVAVYGGIDDSWTESDITWNNADHDGGELAGTAPLADITAGSWVEIDVTDHVQGRLDGEVNFRLESTPEHDQGHVFFDSRETGAGAPQLAITDDVPDPGDTPITDPIPGEPIDSGLGLVLEEFTTVPLAQETPPTARINYLGEVPDGSGRLFVPDLYGTMYLLKDGQPAEYLDVAAEFDDFVNSPGLGTGFGFVAYHPEFADNGLFYTVHTEAGDALETTPDLPGPDEPAVHGVVTEWTATDPSDDTFSGTHREVLRIGYQTTLHGLQEIGFNPLAGPGDDDYGLLYLSSGDGERVPNWTDGPQNLGKPQGKILRIDPQGSDGSSGEYGIPPSNPFVDEPDALGEVYALGMRDPHRFSWDPADGRMFLGHIGEQRVESIYEVQAGDNFGWNEREGAFRFDKSDPANVYPLPEDDDQYGYTYPVAMLDNPRDMNAVVGGFVYRGDALPLLQGKYVFTDVVRGRVFYTDAEDMRRGGEPATIYELNLVDEAGNSVTMLELSGGGSRVDTRLGMDADGELYVLSKRNGTIWRVAGAEEFASCDVGDNVVSDVTSEADWAPVTPEKWEFPGEEVILAEPGEERPGPRRPFEYAVLTAGPEWGSAEVDAEVRVDIPEPVGRDVIIVFGYQSDTEFYYVHLSEDNARFPHNGIFVVDNADRDRIDHQWDGSTGAAPVIAAGMEWHQVRVKHCAETGEIAVYVDGSDAPLMTATDTTFDHGRVGFGSFDEVGRIRNLTVTGTRHDAGPCPAPDQRPTVVIGDQDSDVENRALSDGCTINDVILDDAEWDNKGAFLRHVNDIVRTLRSDGVIDAREAAAIRQAAARSDVGR